MFLQACGVLWFLNNLCVVCFGVLCICIDVYLHELYILDLRRVGVMCYVLCSLFQAVINT